MTQCGEKYCFSLEGSVLKFAGSEIVTRPHDFDCTRSSDLGESLASGEEDGAHSAVAEFPQDPITLCDQRTLTEVRIRGCSFWCVRKRCTGYNRRPDSYR